VDLLNAQLEGASFAGANLAQASITNSHLAHAFFFYTDLRSANFKEADLRGASFHDANLERARFWSESASMEGVCFDNANLQHAILFCDLTLASFKRADLRKAELAGSQIETRQLWRAMGDSETSLPDGVIRPSTWAA
jgi:uncharacterized protein YjbI with pentapeptide repeats